MNQRSNCWQPLDHRDLQICCHIECSTLTESSFRIWNSSAGFQSPPLALFIVMLPSRLPKWSTWDAGDIGSIPGSGRSPGGGPSNPLQYSCLENPMDRGVWQATVHGVSKSQTRLSTHTPMGTLTIVSDWPPHSCSQLGEELTPAGRDVFHGLLFHCQLEQEIL